jgi:Uma2 family endonuclease
METITPSYTLQYQTLVSQEKLNTWDDYLQFRDNTDIEGIFFNQGRLWIDMGKEGINHSTINDLFIMLIGFWFVHKQPEQIFSTFGRCLLEKPPHQAAAPDLVLYLGENYPTWTQGNSRYINLNEWRIPELVGEISDTTIALDLDEKKHLYANLGIPEYWVIDVVAKRVIAFELNSLGFYQECEQSLALKGLKIDLLSQVLSQLTAGTNGSATAWFFQQINNL